MLRTRTDLVAFRKTLATPDMAEAARQVDIRAKALGGVRLVVQGPTPDRFTWAGVKADTGPTECPPQVSMRLTGREVQMRLQLVDTAGLSPVEQRRREVEMLWGIAVPCGFTPWNRYPLAGRCDDVFHFFGPWQVLYDSLLGEGRGEEAWPSLCVAAQVDVGKWEGGRGTERLVQAHLHRLGIPCGVVDGVIGPRTTAGMRAMGLPNGGMTLEGVAAHLSALSPPRATTSGRRRGSVSVDGDVVAVSTGKVALTRTPSGYSFAIDGPGRVILDVGGSS